MGYVVLQRKSQHEYEISDGQQRLITLSLVIVAAIRKIKDLTVAGTDAEENEARADLLTSQFIGTKSAVSLRVDNRLVLNRNNRTNFKSICSRFEIVMQRGLSVTNLLVNQAFQFFVHKPMGTTGEEIAEFVERVASGMMFTKIVVHDDLNAYKVFETLNARGVQLSTPDLLKNYIFSTVTHEDDVTDADLDDIDERWTGIVNQLGDTSFADFIRYHNNSQAAHATKRELFSAVRNRASTPESAYEYLLSLDEYAPIYAALLNPDDTWWGQAKDGAYRDVRNPLQGLRLFSIRQPFPALMAAFVRFSPEEFIRLTRYVYALSVRYNVVCHLSPSEQEHAYNQISVNIFKDTFKRASHVKNSPQFRKLYPDDETFGRAFEFLTMPSRRSSKKIRLLLGEIEAKLGATSESSRTVLEHVCPYHPNERWQQAFGGGVHEVQDRLGNMVILERDDLKQAAFADKRVKYEASGRPLAKKVASYSQWDRTALQEYQAWLAEQAIETWRVGFE